MKVRGRGRIAITGLGVMSPIGNGVDAFHRGLLAGTCGTRAITPRFPTGYRVDLAGVVDDVPVFEDARGRTFGRTSNLAIAAAQEALAAARLPAPERCGVVVGTAMAEALELETRGEDAPGEGPAGGYDGPLLHERVAGRLGLGGPRSLVATTCAAGNHAAGWAADALDRGGVSAMVVVGVDTVGWVDQLGFARLLLQSPDLCRPFDKHRKGTILSEGAGAVVFERFDDARGRGAEILAEFGGCGLSCDAGGAFKKAENDLGPLVAAATDALGEAGLSPDDIDHVSAHGSGTRLNDARETRFLKALLGPRAFDVPITGLKGMLGHAQGAAATLELVSLVLGFGDDVLYPTVHLQTPDPLCDLDYVPNEPRRQKCGVALSSAFGVGGNNAIVVIRRVA